MRTRVHTGGRVNPRSSRRGRQVEGSGGVRPSCPTGTIAAMCLWYQMNLVPPSEGPRRVTIVRGRRRGGGDPARVEAAGSCDDGAGPGVSAAGGGVGSGARVLAVGSGGVCGAAAPCWPSDLGGKARGSWPAGIPDPRRSMGDDGHGADVRVERVRRGGDPAWRACDRGVAVGGPRPENDGGPHHPRRDRGGLRRFPVRRSTEWDGVPGGEQQRGQVGAVGAERRATRVTTSDGGSEGCVAHDRRVSQSLKRRHRERDATRRSASHGCPRAHGEDDRSIPPWPAAPSTTRSAGKVSRRCGLDNPSPTKRRWVKVPQLDCDLGMVA